MGEGYRATLEWGFWKFIRYLITAVIVTALFVWAGVRFGDFDYKVWGWYVNLHLANLWLYIPEVTIICGSILIWKWDRNRKRKKMLSDFNKSIDAIDKARGVK